MKSRQSTKPTTATKKKPGKKSVKTTAEKSVRTSTTKKQTAKTKSATKAGRVKKTAAESVVRKPSKKSKPKTPPSKPASPLEEPTTESAPKIPEAVTPPSQDVIPPSPTAAPVFVKRDLTGPDGSKRPGWEMWIGDHCFGRADNKDLLLASFERLQSPPSSFHWREVRNRMPMRGRPKGGNQPALAAPAPKQPKADEQVTNTKNRPAKSR